MESFSECQGEGKPSGRLMTSPWAGGYCGQHEDQSTIMVFVLVFPMKPIPDDNGDPESFEIRGIHRPP